MRRKPTLFGPGLVLCVCSTQPGLSPHALTQRALAPPAVAPTALAALLCDPSVRLSSGPVSWAPLYIAFELRQGLLLLSPTLLPPAFLGAWQCLTCMHGR
jgi:hypothetical protein